MPTLSGRTRPIEKFAAAAAKCSVEVRNYCFMLLGLFFPPSFGLVGVNSLLRVFFLTTPPFPPSLPDPSL